MHWCFFLTLKCSVADGWKTNNNYIIIYIHSTMLCSLCPCPLPPSAEDRIAFFFTTQCYYCNHLITPTFFGSDHTTVYQRRREQYLFMHIINYTSLYNTDTYSVSVIIDCFLFSDGVYKWEGEIYIQ